MKSVNLAGIVAGIVILGCDAVDRGRPAMGDEDQLIVVMADSVWAGIGDSVYAAVAPRIFAVRDERPFEITQVSPATELWLELQRFKQVIAVGVAGDFWIDQVLRDDPAPTSLPAIVEADNVWARGQSVAAVVLPIEDPLAALGSTLPALGVLLDDRYRRLVRNRMFLSDVNTALRDSLAAEAGFALTLPNIYRPAPPMERLRAFHNRNQVGGDLFRTIVVSWVDGQITGGDAMRVLAWRDSILPMVYDEPQVTGTDRIQVREMEGHAPGSIEVQGVWAGADTTFPTGGPFVDRIVVCPDQDRTYFLEAWMYGPSRPKYQYLIQFETLLDSFHCGG
jgi:hypothetical protein